MGRLWSLLFLSCPSTNGEAGRLFVFPPCRETAALSFVAVVKPVMLLLLLPGKFCVGHGYTYFIYFFTFFD
jgi:hypothetical protein